MKNFEFLNWIYDRMVNIHKENPNYDYMLKFKKLLEDMADLESPNPKNLKEKYWKTGNMVVYRKYLPTIDSDGKEIMNNDRMFMIIGNDSISLKGGSIGSRHLDDNLCDNSSFSNHCWDVMEIWEPQYQENCGFYSFAGLMNTAKLVWSREEAKKQHRERFVLIRI